MYIILIIFGLLGMALFSHTADIIFVCGGSCILSYFINMLSDDFCKTRRGEITKIIVIPLLIYIVVWSWIFDSSGINYLLMSFISGLVGQFIPILGLLSDIHIDHKYKNKKVE